MDLPVDAIPPIIFLSTTTTTSPYVHITTFPSQFSYIYFYNTGVIIGNSVAGASRFSYTVNIPEPSRVLLGATVVLGILFIFLLRLLLRRYDDKERKRMARHPNPYPPDAGTMSLLIERTGPSTTTSGSTAMLEYRRLQPWHTTGIHPNIPETLEGGLKCIPYAQRKLPSFLQRIGLPYRSMEASLVLPGLGHWRCRYPNIIVSLC